MLVAAAGDRFGSARVGQLYGYIHLGAGAAGAIGPMLVGTLRDTTVGYADGLHLIAAALLLGAALPLLSRTRREPRATEVLAPIGPGG